MAKQESFIKLKGNIGDLSFYKNKDGYAAREKHVLNGKRVLTDPNFQRTRENAAEFTRGAKAGSLLREAFRPQLFRCSDHRMTARLFGRMIKVLKLDAVNARGERSVAFGPLELLEGFDFNLGSPLNTALHALYTVQVDRAAGVASIQLPSFIPEEGLAMPQGTTHFKLISGCGILNFEAQVYESVFAESALMPVDAPVTNAVDLQHTLSSGDNLPLFLTLGVQFYQEVNGIPHRLQNGSFNSLRIVRVA